MASFAGLYGLDNRDKINVLLWLYPSGLPLLLSCTSNLDISRTSDLDGRECITNNHHAIHGVAGVDTAWEGEAGFSEPV